MSVEIHIVQPFELRPFDMLGEGRVIRVVHYELNAPGWLVVGDARVVLRDVGDGHTLVSREDRRD